MPNDAAVNKVVTIGTRARGGAPFHVDFLGISREGYQLIRGFGADPARLECELNNTSRGKLFFSALIGSFVHEFRVLPYSENLSEQAAGGGFHTDFMFQPRPPGYTALLCLRPDPRHPIYGRNQVVHRDAFLDRMSSIYGIKAADLLERPIEYSFPNRSPISVPILELLDDEPILRLHTSLMPKGPIESFDNLPLKTVIEAVCTDIAREIVLDQGDLLIVSNHVALHRRSECSFAFDPVDGSFKSREMATVRFDR
jgi:hypothetical protein